MTVSDKSPLPAKLLLSLCALILAFASPLLGLIKFAAQSSLYSHTLLIPLVSLYLIWSVGIDRSPIKLIKRSAGIGLLAFGLISAGVCELARSSGLFSSEQDYLGWIILSFVACVAGLSGVYLGNTRLRTIAFPLGILVFMAPLPLLLEQKINDILQQASAEAALGLFKLLGTPVFYSQLIFKLPGIALEVAPECSGIHSSLILFITSLLAGFLFLRSPSKCVILALATLPLAVLRNGVRIAIIGEMCVHGGPEMIDSQLHRRGGPLFFALSLIPLSLLLWWLWRSDGGRIKSSERNVCES